MTDFFYDSQDDLPPAGTNAILEITAGGSAFIDLAISTSDTRSAVRATQNERILLGSLAHLQAATNALEFTATATTGGVYNDGHIASTNGTGILFSNGGTSSVTNTNSGVIDGAKGIELASSATAAKLEVFNSGTISASGIAVQGGLGDDRIINLGILRTTAADGVVILDLRDGKDLYDGTQGQYAATQGAVTATIKLGAGDDTAYGGAGSETFFGGAGDNYINGGTGIDTVDYSDAAVGITVNLALTGPQGTGWGGDTLVNIENITGSTKNDSLTGNTVNNVLKGGEGDDTLDGGSGDDVLDGGNGNNTVRFSGSSAVTATLTPTGGQATGYGNDTLIGIRNLEGGSGADKLTGNGEANKLVGNNGADTLTGGGGDDDLNGGTGEDTAIFSGFKSSYTITDKGSGEFQIVGPDGMDTLKDIRLAQFDDGTIALVNGAPTGIFLASSSLSEDKPAGTTIDLFGSDPDSDTLTYSLVDNAGGLFSISGDKLVLNRALDYETAKQYVIAIRASDPYGKDFVKTFTIRVNNITETTPLVLNGTKAADTLFGEAGNDRLSGADRNDQLSAAAGNDILRGGNGNDSLYGGDGNDILYGDNGNDVLFGGAGKDIFVLNIKPNVKTNVDYMYDFHLHNEKDVIQFKKSVFTKLAKKGVLSKDAFYAGSQVHDASDRIIYDKKNGALFYDPDGTDHAAAIQIAVLSKNLKLSYKDFFVI